MSETQNKIRDIVAGSPTPAETLRRISRVKAQEVVKRWANHPGKNMQGVVSFRTRNGEATIGGIEYNQDDEKLDAVSVWVGPRQGPPTFRFINPPMLVADPQGTEVLVERDPLRQKDTIRRFRVDPLQALAEVIASHRSGSEKA